MPSPHTHPWRKNGSILASSSSLSHTLLLLPFSNSFSNTPESSPAVAEDGRSKKNPCFRLTFLFQMGCGLLIAFSRIISFFIIIALILLLLGVSTIVLLHVIIVGRACRRAHAAVNRDRRCLESYCGLSADELKKLPCFEISVDERGGATCVVCLESFRPGDSCRMLPACRHTFHAHCLDCWLVRTPLCPICRSSAASRSGVGEVVRNYESYYLNDYASGYVDGR